MSATEVGSGESGSSARAGSVQLKLEVVVIPVKDVERAKEFYGRLGWRLDADLKLHVTKRTGLVEDLRRLSPSITGSGSSSSRRRGRVARFNSART